MMSDKLPVEPDEEVQANENEVSETETEPAAEESEAPEVSHADAPEAEAADEEVPASADHTEEASEDVEESSDEAESVEEEAATEEAEPEEVTAEEEEEEEEEAEAEDEDAATEDEEPEPEEEQEQEEVAETEEEPDLDEEDNLDEEVEESEGEDDEELAAVGAEEEAEPDTNKLWYIVKVQSGREDTIKDAIERRVKIDGLEEYFGQIFIPTEQRTDLRRGKTYTRTVKKLPGYIMAEVEWNDRMLYLFRETPGVGDFVRGNADKPPPPMSPDEVSRWIGKDEAKAAAGDTAVQAHQVERRDAPVSEGDRVRVRTGMFDGMEGEVLEVLHDKNLLRVELQIFGRPVSTELEYYNVEPL